jgi:hypothetical protein
MLIPEYISARVGRPVPVDAFVATGSTPVVSFGDTSKARVATLGLNPSRCEFAPNPRLALSGSGPAEVYVACNGYFSRNPYTTWFDRFNAILATFSAS